MERKAFLKQCGKLCLGGLLAGELLQSCTGTYFAVGSFEQNQLVLNKSEFVISANGKNKFRKYVLLRHEKLPYPIYVYRLNDNTYSALYMECSHNSCELTPHGDFLICPCHGSEFSNVGRVLNPPAENDLRSFKINHDNEKIYIQL